MEKKIVLFGATGLVGAYMAMALKEAGYAVVAIGRRASDNGFFAENGMEYVSLDIQNKGEFSRLPKENVFAVIHFAGAMPAHMRGYNPYEYLSANIIGTMNVLEYTRSVSADRIIFSQSVSDVLYLGGTTTPIPADSEMRHPLTGDHAVYSISKNAAVSLIRHYEAEFGIKAFILRLPTIYAYHPNPYYYVNGAKKMLGYRYLIKRAEAGDPQSQKEFVYVDDFTQLCEGCLKYHTDERGGVLLMRAMAIRLPLASRYA